MLETKLDKETLAKALVAANKKMARNLPERDAEVMAQLVIAELSPSSTRMRVGSRIEWNHRYKGYPPCPGVVVRMPGPKDRNQKIGIEYTSTLWDAKEGQVQQAQVFAHELTVKAVDPDLSKGYALDSGAGKPAGDEKKPDGKPAGDEKKPDGKQGKRGR